MPLIEVTMIEGRTPEAKRELMRRLTDVVAAARSSERVAASAEAAGVAHLEPRPHV